MGTLATLSVRAALLASLVPIVSAPLPALAQEPSDRVRVFVDCQTFGCRGDAFDHFRREIEFVSWVRDRQVADVQVLVTSERTGGSGQVFTLAFLGLQRFNARSDTLATVVPSQATEDERRAALTRTLALGLVGYAARTTDAARLDVRFHAPEGTAEEQTVRPEDDPWNFWVMELNGNAFFRGQSQTTSTSFFWSARGTRTTEEWKLRLGIFGSYSENNFETDDLDIKTVSRAYRGFGTAVKSLGPHWSAGVRSEVNHTTRFNEDLTLRGAAVLEYNVYPYAESTRRQLILQYSIGAVSYNWIEETLLGETSETHPEHALVIGVEQRQPWGSVDVTAGLDQLLDDPSSYSLSVDGNVRVRLIQGLSLRVGGAFSQIRNQLFLPRRDATDEEVLLSLRQLETDFSYFGSFGFEYTFGSIFNTVVNPRLDREVRNIF